MSVTLLECEWIVPVIPRDQIYHHHTLVIKDSKIIDLLEQQQARRKYPDAQPITYSHHIMIPGLVNAHTHSPMNLLRGLADDIALMQWLQQHIWPAEQQFVSPEFVTHGSELAIAEMIASGTTCFNDMYFFPQQTAIAAEQAGMRAVLGQIIIDFPSAYAKTADDYFRNGLNLREMFLDSKRISTALAPHAPYSVSDENLTRVGELAAEYQLKIHIHLQESRDEIEESLNHYHKRPLKRLLDLGLVNTDLIAVHMTQLNDEDLNIIRESQPHIVHCPESNMKLASGIAPIVQLEQITNVCLGTDSAASNNDLNMWGEMKTAAMLAKVVNNDPRQLAAQQLLEMATINAARALGLEQQIGSLENGKFADLCIVDIDTPESIPLYHPLSQLVYACSREHVSDVWIHGKQVYRNRQHQTLDIEKIKHNTCKWQQKITQFS